jgi:Tfp pilus assembly protein PilN
LFDELRKVTPKGVYLTSLVQKGGDLTVVGKSESNSMVSEYMHAIEQSKYLAAPKLKIVKEATNTMVGGQTKNQDNDFTMFLKQKEDKKPKEGEDAKNVATVKPGVK